MPFSNTRAPLRIYKKGSHAEGVRTITVNCLGDSITNGYGSGTSFPATDYKPYYRYWEDCYMAKTNNCGENGSYVADYERRYLNNVSTAFVKRVDLTMNDNNADLITIMGGVNDCQSGYDTDLEFGDLYDPSATDPRNFCGAVRTMIQKLRKKYPNALIVYLTPLKYNGQYANRWENEKALPRYIEAIQLLCIECEVPCIDLYTPDALHFCDTTEDPLIFGDRLHFGRTAHRELANYIMSQLEDMKLVEILD